MKAFNIRWRRLSWQLVLGALAALALLLPPLAGVTMAVATYAVTTSKTDVNTLWRKVQGPLQVAAQFMVDEWDMLDDLEEFDVDWSAREITAPVDLDDDVNTASIVEGGYEARPFSPTPVDATFTWILFNARFTISKTARFIDERNRKAMLERQLAYQGRKKLQGMARRLGDYFYGFSTAIMAKVVSTSGSDIVIKDMYGVAGLGSTSPSTRVVDLFRKNEYIAILNPTGPAIRGFSKITAITASTKTLTVDAVPGGTVANDLIVFAGNVEAASGNLSSSDYNNGLTGLFEITGVNSTVSLHGISTLTQSKWAAGYTDTGGGRFSGIKVRKARQGINNNGGGDADMMLWSQGVENDVVAQLQAGVRYTDSFTLEMDGTPKFRGITIKSTRRVPPGFAFVWTKKSLRKMTLLPKPSGTPAWAEGYKLQDQSGYIFGLDYPCALVCVNRGNFAYFSGLTEA